jgi:outer membrane lipoprotein-sorting protein
MYRLSVICALFLTIAEGSAQPSGEEILRKVQGNFSGIRDYTVDLDVTADIERVNVPPMHVRMYYKQPDRVHFESEGFALLPREAVGFNPARVLSTYSVESVGEEGADSAKQYLLELKPNTDRTKLRRLLLCVDPERWTAERIISPLFDGRTMTASFQYEYIEGYWLPSLVTVSFASSSNDTADTMAFDQRVPGRRSQVPRHGTIQVRYSNYKVNEGLSDDIFSRDSGDRKD